MRAVAENMSTAADSMFEELQRETNQHNEEQQYFSEGNKTGTPLASLPPPLPHGYSHSDAHRTAREASTMVCIFWYIIYDQDTMNDSLINSNFYVKDGCYGKCSVGNVG